MRNYINKKEKAVLRGKSGKKRSDGGILQKKGTDVTQVVNGRTGKIWKKRFYSLQLSGR